MNHIVDTKQTTRKIEELREAQVSGESIKSLRIALGQSLSEFGNTLRKIIDPKAEYPFTRQYISRLEKGKSTITPEISAAYWELEGRRADVPSGLSGTILVPVLAFPGQVPEGITPYIAATAEVKRCENPLCNVWFIKTHSTQKYHHPDCRPNRHSR